MRGHVRSLPHVQMHTLEVERDGPTAPCGSGCVPEETESRVSCGRAEPVVNPVAADWVTYLLRVCPLVARRPGLREVA